MAMRNVKSSFPVSLGAQITGVDANTYSITGNSFSTIVLPGEHSQTSVTLQEDDCSLGKQRILKTFVCTAPKSVTM
jgi:hypothetical protein